jgi:peptidoglycan/LPS O-acetylase OafA/YrhL
VAYYFFIGLTVHIFRQHAFKVVVTCSVISLFLETALLSSIFLVEFDLHRLSDQIPFKFYYFGLGVIIYNYHRSISTLNLLTGASVCFCGFYVFNMDFLFLPLFIVSFVFLVAFKLPVIDFSKFGDLSYGLYIFHFPLIQLFVDNDWLTGSVYIDFFIAISILLMLSRFSWLFIERIAISYGKRNY